MNTEKNLKNYLDEKPTLEEWLNFCRDYKLNMPLRQVWEKLIYKKEPNLEFIKNSGISPMIGSDVLYFSCIQAFYNDQEINTELFEWAVSKVKKKDIIKQFIYFFKQYQMSYFIQNKMISKLENIIIEHSPRDKDKFLYFSVRAQDLYSKRYKMELQNDTIDNYLRLYSNNKDYATKLKNPELLSLARSIELNDSLNSILENKIENKKIKI